MATAPDGSPVELYALLPALGEAEVVHAAVPEGAEILELGCGAGRVTHALLALGHRVVAVDESREMLAHVRGAETARASIAGLDLGRRFPVVLLASNFLNTPGRARRRELLDACARHVAGDGVVICERTPADWQAPTEPVELGGEVVLSLRDVRRSGRFVAAVAVYEHGEDRWEHAYTAELVPDNELVEELREAGLELDRWLDDRNVWLAGRPPAASRHTC